MKNSHAARIGGKHAAAAALARETLHASLNLAALGSLMREFAHVGNNRLMVIMSCLDVLSLDTVEQHDRREALALATGASRQLADDLGALLTGARAQVAHLQRLELGDALQKAMDLYDYMTLRAAPVELGSRSSAWVQADPTELQAALLRLLLGARQLGATAMAASIAVFDFAELADDLPMLRKGQYAGIELQCVGATVPQRLVQRGTAQANTLDLLRDPAGLEFAAVAAYAHSVRGALHIRHEDSCPRIRLLLPLQERAAATG